MKTIIISLLLTFTCPLAAHAEIGVGLSWGYGWQKQKLINTSTAETFLQTDKITYNHSYGILPAIEVHLKALEMIIGVEEIANNDEYTKYGVRAGLYVRFLRYEIFRFRLLNRLHKINLMAAPGIHAAFRHFSNHVSRTDILLTGMLRIGPELMFGPLCFRITARPFVEYGLGFYSFDNTYTFLHSVGGGFAFEGGVYLYFF